MFNSKLAGYFKIEVKEPNGSIRTLADWFPNLILSQGLDRIGVGVDWMDCCHVGSGSAVPLDAQVAMTTYVAGTSTVTSNITASSAVSPWYTYHTRIFSFGAGVAAGVLTEVGVGWNTTGDSLFSRALILDGGGAPTSVSVGASEVLLITYQFRRYICEVDTTGTVTLNSIVYTFTGRAAEIDDVAYWPAIFSYAMGTASCATYNGGIGAIITVPSTASGTATTTETITAYVAGTYTAEWKYDFASAEGNATTGILSVLVAMCGGLYQIEFSSAIPKTTAETLSLTFQASWARELVPGQFCGVAGSDNGALFAGLSIIGDRKDGKIYSLNMNTYTDKGNEITRVRRTQIINKERVNVLHHKIELEFEPGVGLDVAPAVDGYDPKIALRWSDDDGNNWSTAVEASIGVYQAYGTRAIWRRLGKSRNRIYEFSIVSPVKVIVIGAYADLTDCRV